jgi:hypothetical protein
LVRFSLYDPYKEYWIKSIDLNVSEKYFFYNVASKETRYLMPIAFLFFGDRFLDEYEKQNTL